MCGNGSYSRQRAVGAPRFNAGLYKLRAWRGVHSRGNHVRQHPVRAVKRLHGWRVIGRIGRAIVLCGLLSSCLDMQHTLADQGNSEPIAGRLRAVVHNPYAEVDWAGDRRLKVQLHDHAGIDLRQLASYDAAGYDAVSLMTYSGVASLGKSWKERHWPPEDWLPRAFLDSLRSIKLFIPSGEEVGRGHITSSFMTTYIALWQPAYYPQREPWHYGSTQECIDLIRTYGGIPILAHPWLYYDHPGGVSRFAGIEVYSAYVPGAVYQGILQEGAANFVGVWDSVLSSDASVIGIAVNDHYGPYWTGRGSDSKIRDSGKTIVLAPELTLAALQERLAAGAAFSVKDFGVQKDRYPVVRSIVVGDSTIDIEADGDIRWIGNGSLVGEGHLLDIRSLPAGTRYVRAEISNTEGSVVFTQAFGLGTREPSGHTGRGRPV